MGAQMRGKFKMAAGINWKEIIKEQIRVFNKYAEELKKEKSARKRNLSATKNFS
jgi:hypothetical protein